MLKDFAQFIREFNVASLAVGFVMGTASTALVNSLVKDIFMPLVAPLMATDNWKDAVLHLGPINMAYGAFLAELMNFVILAAIIFFLAKKILKIEAKKK